MDFITVVYGVTVLVPLDNTQAKSSLTEKCRKPKFQVMPT